MERSYFGNIRECVCVSPGVAPVGAGGSEGVSSHRESQ